MKWMVPINQLDAVQSSVIDEILDDIESDHLVKGFAGSGKTIVLTHVLERLASHPKRRSICFATYTHALKDLVESGLSELGRRHVDISTFDALKRIRKPYDIVVADELQDVTGRYFDAFSSAYRTLIAAADFDQRIYRQAAKRGDIDGILAAAEEHELQEIHHINDNVFRVATSILDADVPLMASPRQDDETTQIYRGSSKQDEFNTVHDEAVRVAAREHPSAILFPNKRLLKEFIDAIANAADWGKPPPLESGDENRDKYGVMNGYLHRQRSSLQVFGSGSGEMAASDRKAIVYLMTYHSAKGLDFPNVFLPHLTAGTKLEPMTGAKDEEERRLFFVAATRAKRRLYLSYHGTAHRFIDEIDDSLLTKFKKPKRTY